MDDNKEIRSFLKSLRELSKLDRKRLLVKMKSFFPESSVILDKFFSEEKVSPEDLNDLLRDYKKLSIAEVMREDENRTGDSAKTRGGRKPGLDFYDNLPGFRK